MRMTIHKVEPWGVLGRRVREAPCPDKFEQGKFAVVTNGGGDEVKPSSCVGEHGSLMKLLATTAIGEAAFDAD